MANIIEAGHNSKRDEWMVEASLVDSKTLSIMPWILLNCTRAICGGSVAFRKRCVVTHK